MARFFFNMHDGVSMPDTVGSEHASLQSARKEAVETIAERLKGSLLKDADISAWLMNVTDDQGFTVIVLSFSAAVQIVDHNGLASARSAES
ncbi:hypothetical protein HFN76_28165 [Rhizobium laguerreae]|uniref:DUF6894 family protein n=1 Tax=Rhizobium laguerreae TaxID=1076926 RepID=UPI001C91FB92|nr:hypothetical protein [Rhizobium laguerreae]MBY3516058.1 hypothetical protein [Rhizobium laguerreae]